MPIHVRAEPGDYAEAVLLPGDPLRAKYIAETYLDDVVAAERRARPARLHRHLQGQAGLGAGHGHGLPGRHDRLRGAVQLGCKKLIRVGTCGGLQPHHALGDLIVALTAVPADSTAMHLVGERAALPDRVVVDSSTARCTRRRSSASSCTSARSSRATSSTTRTSGQYERWSKRGVLAVEMEAAALFTVGALRGVETGLPAHRQRHRRRGRVQADLGRRAARVGRSDDEDRARRRDRRLTRRHASARAANTVFLVNPASANGATGKRWPELAHRAARARAARRDAVLRAAGPPDRARARSRRRRRRGSSSRSAATGR